MERDGALAPAIARADRHLNSESLAESFRTRSTDMSVVIPPVNLYDWRRATRKY
jgi:hypothetical protein